MSKFFIFVVLSASLSLSNRANAQTDCTCTFSSKLDKKIYTYADIMPVFEDDKGNDMITYIADHFTYPEQETFVASFNVTFIVDEKGKVLVPQIITKNKLTPADKSLLTVFKQMPNWQPGTCKGTPVAVRMKVRVVL